MAFDEKSISIYSSRDKIRNELIELSKNYLELQNFDFNSASYLSYLINVLSSLDSNLIYLISSIYKEQFLTKAMQRESIISWANLLGYDLEFASPSTLRVLFEMEIPAYSEIKEYSSIIAILLGRQDESNIVNSQDDGEIFKVYTSSGIPFSLKSTVKITFVPNADTSSVTPEIVKQVFNESNQLIATQNLDFRYNTDSKIQFVLEFIQIDDQVEKFTIPDLLPNEFHTIKYKFPKKGYLADINLFTIELRDPNKYLTNNDTTTLEQWTMKSTIYGSSPDDTVFGYTETSDGILITFGNGIIGKQPKTGMDVIISVGTTYGTLGNVISGSIKSGDQIRCYGISSNEDLYSIKKQIKYYVTNVEPGVNGKDAPTSEELRQNILKNVSANNRLVSSVDYANATSIVKDLPITKFYHLVKRSDLKRNEITLYTELVYDGLLVPTKNIKISNIFLDPDETNKLIKAFSIYNIDNIDYYTLFDINIDSNKLETTYIYTTNNAYFPLNFHTIKDDSIDITSIPSSTIVPMSCYLKQNTNEYLDIYLKCSLIEKPDETFRYVCKMNIPKLMGLNGEIEIKYMQDDSTSGNQHALYSTFGMTTGINNQISNFKLDETYDIFFTLYRRKYYILDETGAIEYLDISSTNGQFDYELMENLNYLKEDIKLNYSSISAVLRKNLNNYMYSQVSHLDVTMDVNVGEFYDKSLENAIRIIINKPIERILLSDLESIETLDISNLNLNSLQGLQYCTNLKSLTATGNNIFDLNPLSNLIKLEYLNLDDNQIVDISPLNSLIVENNISEIYLGNNFISSISTLFNDINDLTETNTSLNVLDLRNNNIIHLTAIMKFKNLIKLYLGFNNITHLDGLVNENLYETLTVLSLEKNDLISGELEKIQFYYNIEELNIRDCNITEQDLVHINILKDVVKKLDLGENQILSLAHLSQFSVLTHLWLDHNRSKYSDVLLNNLSGLNISALKNTLIYLNLSMNDIQANEIGLKIINQLTSLITLQIGGNYNLDMTPSYNIWNLKNLTELNLRATSIGKSYGDSEFPFNNLTRLTSIGMSLCKNIRNISALFKLTNLKRVALAFIAETTINKETVQKLYSVARARNITMIWHTFTSLTNCSPETRSEDVIFPAFERGTWFYDWILNYNPLYFESKNQIINNQYLYNLYDVPVVKKSYYDNLTTNQMNFNTTILDKITSFNPFTYKMLTDYINLKFSNTTGKSKNMLLNKTNISNVLDINIFQFPIQTLDETGAILTIGPAIGDRYAFSSNNTPWYSYFKPLLDLEYTTGLPYDILEKTNGFIAEYKFDQIILKTKTDILGDEGRFLGDSSTIVVNDVTSKLYTYDIDTNYSWEKIGSDILDQTLLYDSTNWVGFEDSGFEIIDGTFKRTSDDDVLGTYIEFKNTPWQKNMWYKISFKSNVTNGSFLIKYGNRSIIPPGTKIERWKGSLLVNDVNHIYTHHFQVSSDDGNQNLILTNFTSFIGEIWDLHIQPYYGYESMLNDSVNQGYWELVDLKINDIIPVSYLKNSGSYNLKKFIYNGSKLVEPVFDIPLKIELIVQPSKSLTISHIDLINNIKTKLIEELGPFFDYNKSLYRSQIIDIVQNVTGVQNCTLLYPEHDIFFDEDPLKGLSQEDILTYSPELIYFTTNTINILIKD